MHDDILQKKATQGSNSTLDDAQDDSSYVAAKALLDEEFCCFSGSCDHCDRIAEVTNFCAISREMCIGHCSSIWCVSSDASTSSTIQPEDDQKNPVVAPIADNEVHICNSQNLHAVFRDISIQ